MMARKFEFEPEFVFTVSGDFDPETQTFTEGGYKLVGMLEHNKFRSNCTGFYLRRSRQVLQL